MVCCCEGPQGCVGTAKVGEAGAGLGAGIGQGRQAGCEFFVAFCFELVGFGFFLDGPGWGEGGEDFVGSCRVVYQLANFFSIFFAVIHWLEMVTVASSAQSRQREREDKEKRKRERTQVSGGGRYAELIVTGIPGSVATFGFGLVETVYLLCDEAGRLRRIYATGVLSYGLVQTEEGIVQGRTRKRVLGGGVLGVPGP